MQIWLIFRVLLISFILVLAAPAPADVIMQKKSPAETNSAPRPLKKREKIKLSRVMRSFERNNLFLSVVESYQQQAARELQTNSDTIYDVSKFTGTSLFFAVGEEKPLNANWSGKLSLVLRQTNMRGDAVVTGTTTTNKFNLRQNFIGAEAALRYSPYSWGNWSALFSFEYSVGTSVKLKVESGAPVDESGIKPPNFIIPAIALAYDARLTDHFFLEPSLRAGSVASANPFIILVEGIISGKYTF